MVAPSPRVAPAGRGEEYVNGPRVRLDNPIRRSLKRKRNLPQWLYVPVMAFELDRCRSTALNRAQNV